MKFFTITLSILLLNLGSLAGQNILNGRILDSEGQPLAYANVVITHTVVNGKEIALKTQMGSVSDFDGNYVITNVPGGTVKVSFIYIGYVQASHQVTFGDSETQQTLDVVLKSESISLEEVVVTAQAKGQMAAINQQINALTIKNVVSADRIQQNPDANAAEALGRLPGVTVTRSGGEANGIVVRGMQGYNNVTINGVDVPVNLTSISQYALQNVEVFKSVTPDMDAGAPAGTVNLKLGTAPDENATTILAQAGYSDLNKTFKNYKFNISSNWRFFDKKLGFRVNLSTEATDRSTEQLTAGIGLGNQSVVAGEEIKLQTGSVNLLDVDRTIKRNSAILTSDYRFSPSASIEWSNIVTHSPGGPMNVTHSYNGGGSSSYELSDHTGNNAYNYTSILTAKHLLGRIKVDYSASVGYAHNTSKRRTTRFQDPTAFESTLTIEQMQTLSHKEFVNLAQIENTTESMNQYHLLRFQPDLAIDNGESNDLNIDTRINMEYSYTIGGIISGNLKWGGRYKRRNYDQKSYGVTKGSWIFDQIILGNELVAREDGSLWNDDINLTPEDHEDGWVLGSYLLNQNNYNDNFFNEGYNFGWYPHLDRVNHILDWYDDMTNDAYNRGQEYWEPIYGQIEQLQKENFGGNAAGTKDHFIDHYAAYVMTEMKIGKNLHFIPGVRYEKYHYDMNAWNIRQEIISGLQLTGEPVNATHDNEFFLPMAQLKYEPVKWLQGLFSYTETLKRPGVTRFAPGGVAGGQLEPWVEQDKMSWKYNSGNPNLQPEHWTSIDFGVAAHSGKIGLFSVNLFYKKVEDKIAYKYWTKMSLDTDIELGSFQPDERVDVTELSNHPYDGFAKGIEVEWQTNFWYLPKPFTYFTLNLNYSYINNNTTYVNKVFSDSLIGYRGNRPIYEQIQYDELVEGPMINQPSQLFNGQLGFSYRKFETTLSYQYIGETFIQKNIVAEMDQFKSAFHRLDWQARYQLPLKGMELMFNMANMSDTQEVKKRRGDDRPTSVERYGWSADLGLRFTFY